MQGFDDLLDGFGQIEIWPDDVVMVHSSYKSIGGVHGGAETVVSALAWLVHPKGGALFFPRYTVDAWCNRRYFDLKETPGEMGIIPEVSAQMGGSRTRHPVHNFNVLGEWKHEYNFDNIESFSKRGPFGYFHEKDGLVISVGVPWDDTISFVHYVEQAAQAEFRRTKHFAGIYVDYWGEAKLRTYQMSVRRSLSTITHVAPLYDEVLVPQGVVKQVQVGDATVSYFRCQEYYDAVFPLVKQRPGLFHYVEGWNG